MSSVVLGLMLMALTLVWVALGTFDPVLRAADFDMIDWYRFKPFQAVMFLMCVNLTVVTFRRIALNLPNLGVWVIHGSILLLAFGSTWFGYFWVDAATRIDRGKTQSHCYSHNHWDWVLHVWRPGTEFRSASQQNSAATGAAGSSAAELRPELDGYTGYAAGDLSTQYALPDGVTQHRFRGGYELSDAVIRELLPRREDVEADLSDEQLRQRATAVLNRLRQNKPPRWFATFEELERFVTAAGGVRGNGTDSGRPDPLAKLRESTPEYRLPPITTAEGLRLTVEASWPRVDVDEEIVECTEPTASLSAITVWSHQGRSRRTMFASDPSARRFEVTELDAIVGEFQKLIRLATEARAAGRPEAAAHYGGRAVEYLTLVGARTEARRFLVAERSQAKSARGANSADGAALTVGDVEAARAFYRFAQQRSAEQLAAQKRLAIQPPRPVELLLITDARLRVPLIVPLEDWIATPVISLSAAGLPGAKLTLEKCEDAAVVLASHSPEEASLIRRPILVYSVTDANGIVSKRVLVNGQTADTAKLDAGAASRAEVDVSADSPLMVHLLQCRTAAVQAVVLPPEREAAKTAGAAPALPPTDRLVWSLTPGLPPFLARVGNWDASTNADIQRHYEPCDFFWDNQVVRLLVSRSMRARVEPKILPVAAGTKETPRAIRVLAEYQYTDPADGATKNWQKHFWLIKAGFPDIQRFELPEIFAPRLEVPTLGPVEIGWSGRRIPLGREGTLRATLDHFAVENMPGDRNAHKEYASYATFFDAADATGRRAQTVKVCMNEPKKADHWWFSQASYDSEKLSWTVLSVAHKPGWSDPPIVPYSMAMMVAGVLWAFLVKPAILARRRAAAAAGGESSESESPGKSGSPKS